VQPILENIEKTFGREIEFNCPKHGTVTTREKHPGCDICVREAAQDEERERQRQAYKAMMERRWLASGMPKKFCGVSLDDWIADTEAKCAAKAAAQDFANGRTLRMLMLGNCGTGKTMLSAGIIGAMSLCKKVDEYGIKTHINPVYTTSTRLIRAIRDSWRKKEMTEQQAMNNFIDADVLVVDELGAGRCSEDDKQIFSEILCDRYSADMPTLLISNLTGEQLKSDVLDERAADRIREGGKIVKMQWISSRLS